MVANLPVLRHKITLTEEDNFIVLDITDETGGLGLKLMLDPHVASSLGARMMDRARFYASKDSTDPKRNITDEFTSQADWKGSPAWKPT